MSDLFSRVSPGGRAARNSKSIMVNDPIGDIFAAIRNAGAVQKPVVVGFHSNFREVVAKFLEEKGLVGKVKVFKSPGQPGKQLQIELKYLENGEPRLTILRRVSRPGSRIYASASDLKRLSTRWGETIVSTSRGVMFGSEAIKKRLGGEVVGEVW